MCQTVPDRLLAVSQADQNWVTLQQKLATPQNDPLATNTTSNAPRTNPYHSVKRVRTSLGRGHVITFLPAGRIRPHAQCARVSFQRVHPIFAASGLCVHRSHCPEACTGQSRSK